MSTSNRINGIQDNDNDEMIKLTKYENRNINSTTDNENWA